MNDTKCKLWIGILILWLSHLTMDFMLGVWNVYKTFITLDLIIAGLIASLCICIGDGLQLFFGFLSDRGFHQRLIAWGVGLTITVPFLAYTDNEWILFLFILCAYIGSGSFHPAASRLLVASSSTFRSSLIALFACGGMIGAASSQYVFIQVHYWMDGHTWMLAIPVILLAMSCHFFKFPEDQVKIQKIDRKKLWEALKPRRVELILLYLIELCLQTVCLSLTFLLPDVLKIKGYEEWFCLGGGQFYFVMGSALASIPIGYCIDRIGYKPILGAIIVGSIGFLYLFLVTESLSLFPVILLLMAIGGTMGVIVPVVVAGGNSLVPSYASGVISGLYMGGVGLVAGFGPILTSLMASFFLDDAAVIALQVLSGLLMIALGLLYFLPNASEVVEMEEYPIKV